MQGTQTNDVSRQSQELFSPQIKDSLKPDFSHSIFDFNQLDQIANRQKPSEKSDFDPEINVAVEDLTKVEKDPDLVESEGTCSTRPSPTLGMISGAPQTLKFDFLLQAAIQTEINWK